MATGDAYGTLRSSGRPAGHVLNALWGRKVNAGRSAPSRKASSFGLAAVASPGRRGLDGGRRAQQHHERTRDDRFRLLLEVPEGSHDPRTVGMQLAKFTTVGSVRGSSRLD